jgi:two-component system sensor histidine kinase YesM
MTAAFLLSSMITFVLVGAASYYTIYSILYNKIERNIQLTLDQVSREIELAMDNLLSVAGQLTYGGIVSDDLANFLATDSYSSKRFHYDHITTYLALIDHTNPTAGLHFYYRTDSQEILFDNGDLSKPFNLDILPILTDKTLFAFYGPHPSFAGGQQDRVISLFRPVNIRGEYDLMLYLESNINALPRILNAEQFGMPTSYALINDAGVVVYSEFPELFPPGSVYEGGIGSRSDAYVYESESRYGWTLAAAFDKREFTREIRLWALRVAVLGVGMLLVSLLLGMIVWRSVYKPIEIFKKEIGELGSDTFDRPIERANVAEFDKVLRDFQQMKFRIQTLLEEVQQQERAKQQLEVDKLLSQINPHFLYNTLNTVQWIARAEGQTKIVKLVADLTRLLRYNLGKEGSLVTIEREVAALKDYVAIQLVRNDHQFSVRYEVDESVLKAKIPRFILQPLVENAIYHGLDDMEGTIAVRIARAGEGMIRVSVQDDGRGLSEAQKELLLSGEREERQGVGLGIGLSYVNKMLKVHYGDAYRLEIDSEPNVGTTYRFVIPDRREMRA